MDDKADAEQQRQSEMEIGALPLQFEGAKRERVADLESQISALLVDLLLELDVGNTEQVDAAQSDLSSDVDNFLAISRWWTEEDKLKIKQGEFGTRPTLADIPANPPKEW
jgi:hypothetical protein